MKQLQQALIDGGLVAHLDDDNNIMLVGHRSRPITGMDILEVIYPDKLDRSLVFVETGGIVKICRRDAKRRSGNTRGPMAIDRSKIVRPEIGPAFGQKMQDALNRFMDMGKEARALEILHRDEDRRRDQLETLERSAGQ